MRVYGITRVQWIAMAIVLGALLAWLQSGSARTAHTQTHAPATLEGLLVRQPVKGEDGSIYPWTRRVTVYPPTAAGFTVTGAQGEIDVIKSAVTFEALTASPDRKGWIYRPGTTLVSVPVQARGGQTFANASEYLDSLAANRDWVTHRYAWWADPQYAYPAWIGGCVAVIGICWPTLLGLLMRSGYGPSPEEIAAERKERGGWLKAWFTPAAKAEQSTKAPVSRELSEEELERIAKMEEDLRDFAVTRAEQVADQPMAERPVRELNAMPLEQTPVPQQTREAQDYDGEFYPTVAHAKKKHEPKR